MEDRLDLFPVAPNPTWPRGNSFFFLIFVCKSVFTVSRNVIVCVKPS